MKTCTKCCFEKPLTDFYKQPISAPTKDGRTYWCKQCYAKNYEDNKERQKLSNRKAAIKRRYGLSLSEYELLITKGCSICGPLATTRIVLDHCHVSNSVRSPLCNNCNVLLGSAHDNPQILRDAADYLERHAAL